MRTIQSIKRAFVVGTFVAIGMSVVTATFAQEEAEHPGLKVGDDAPSFTLKDQKNKDVKLEELLKKKPVAIVFHRSASW